MTRVQASILSLAISLTSFPAAAFEPPPTPKAAPTAEDDARAKELFANGSELYKGGSYEPAIAAFTQAYALSGDPVLLFNISQAYDRAAKYDEAIEYTEYYRAFAPASERDSLTERVASLRMRKLKAEADAASSETTPTRAPAETATDASVTNPPSDSRNSEGPPPDQAPKQKVFTPLAIVLTAVAAVGAGTGIGLGVASKNRREDAEAVCSSGSPIFCPSTAEADLDASRGFATGADVSFAVAGAAAIGVIIVVAVNASRRNKAQTAHRERAQKAGLAVVPQRRGAGLVVRF